MSNPVAHVTAASATVGSISGLVFHWMPGFLAGLASLGAVCWYGIQLYESKTVQRWLSKHHPRYHAFTRKAQDHSHNPDHD